MKMTWDKFELRRS